MLSEWRGNNTTLTILHEYKVRLTAASGGLVLAEQPQNSRIDAICYLQGACLQARIAIELLFFALLSSRNPIESSLLGSTWTTEHRPASIKRKLERTQIRYWPERITTTKHNNNTWQASSRQDVITPAEAIKFYGNLSDALHAKRNFVIGDDALSENDWIKNGMAGLRDQTDHFALYSEDLCKHIITMRWGEDNAPHLVTLAPKNR